MKPQEPTTRTDGVDAPANLPIQPGKQASPQSRHDDAGDRNREENQWVVATGSISTTDAEVSAPIAAHERESSASPPQELARDSGVQIVDQGPLNGADGANPPRPSASIPSHSGPLFEIVKIVLFPALILFSILAGLVGLGVAQRIGWLQPASIDGAGVASSADSAAAVTSYICPMMCIPPTTKPGRCPVCGMELVPASAQASNGPSSVIEIDPRARRVSGINTVTAESQILYREIRSVGEIQYDESKLKTIAAYVDGRIEELFADYTGVDVKKGDVLALLYSPELYAAQVEFARTLQFIETAQASNDRVADENRRLLESSRERLRELGMTADQIEELERSKSPLRRLNLFAPISGTVIERLAVSGQYVDAGTPVYRLADLSTVWLVLELFPDDARLIPIGHPVTATVQSLGDDAVHGTVEFVEPSVDPQTKTLGVRVAIDNKQGILKPGEFARATIRVPLMTEGGSPRETVVVPRNSLLSVGDTALVYVESKPGEFHLRNVKIGPSADGKVAIFEGVAAGESVVVQSTFLLDAQMQLQGNPSLIDPDKANSEPQLSAAEKAEIDAALSHLSDEDRSLALEQVICPVTEVRLGSMGMGVPIRIDLDGTAVFICCEGCRDSLLAEPQKYLDVLQNYKSKSAVTSNAAARRAPDTDSANESLPRMELPQMDLPKMDLPKMN